jgi:hypothetical protein
MKKTLIITGCLLGIGILSSFRKSNGDLPGFGDFAQATPNKDTLFLLEGDRMSTVTYEIWKSDPKWKGNNPYIKFVCENEMKKIKSRSINATAKK